MYRGGPIKPVGGMSPGGYGKGGCKGMAFGKGDMYGMGAYGMPACGGFGGYGFGGGMLGPPAGFAGRAAGYGTSTGGLATAKVAKAKPLPSGPTINWINLTDESALTAEGLPAEAPVLTYEKGVSVFASTTYLVHDLVGDKEVEIIHDPDWNLFPEVGGAMKEAGLEENCFAVAKADGRWAVGMGGNWKNRENASKLALCVALAGDSPKLESILRMHSDFAQMLEKAGLAEAPPPGEAPVKSKKSKAASNDDSGGPATIPAVNMVTLTEESTITAEGLPADAPALCHDKAAYVYSEGHNLLSELVGDISSEVVFTHDADGDKFPEVNSAIQESLGQPWCFCIASCAQFNKWGLGLAGGWKDRERAAKVALAVAICSEGGPNLDSMAASYPGFGEVMTNAGYEPSGDYVPPVLEEAPAKKRKKGKTEDSELAAMGGLGGDSGKPELPKNTPFWLNLASPPAVLIDGMPSETLLLFGEEGTRKALYAHVDNFLAEFVESIETDIEFVDDPNWENFPEVGAALEEYKNEDACLHIAVCGSAGIWAAGVGRKWKSRNAAAKVALGTVLALRLADSGEGPDMTGFPEFSKFIEEAAALA